MILEDYTKGSFAMMRCVIKVSNVAKEELNEVIAVQAPPSP